MALDMVYYESFGLLTYRAAHAAVRFFVKTLGADALPFLGLIKFFATHVVAHP